MAELLFYLLAAGAIAFGVGVVRARMPLFSVLCLLGAFVCMAGIFLLAGQPFLAATQILVYVGAIMVLFLFVVMLLNLGDVREMQRQTGAALEGARLALAGFVAASLAVTGVLAAGWGESLAAVPAAGPTGSVGVVVSPDSPESPDPTGAASVAAQDERTTSVSAIAEVLFSRYMLPFEAASLLLLATMVAVIALAKRDRAASPSDLATNWPWKKEASS